MNGDAVILEEISPAPTLPYVNPERETTPEKVTACEGCNRRFKSINTYGKIFLAQVTLETVVLVVLEIFIILNIVESNLDQVNRTRRLTYAILLSVCEFFFLIFGWDAILNDNHFQLVTFMLFSVGVTAYAIVQVVNAVESGVFNLWLAQLVVLGVGEFVLFAVGYNVYQALGWKVYKRVGSDRRMRGLYKTYLILVTTLKLDTAIQLALIVQNTALALQPTDPEFILNFFAIGLVLIIAAILFIAVRSENRLLTIAFFCLSPLEPAYILFKDVRFLTVTTKNYDQLPVTELVISGMVAIALRILLVGLAIRCFRNYGKQLQKYIGGPVCGQLPENRRTIVMEDS